MINKEYHSKKDKYTYFDCFKTGLSLSEMKRRGHEGVYIVSGRVGINGELIKRYFSKSIDAIKYYEMLIKNYEKGLK
jgi:hypothetical protein